MLSMINGTPPSWAASESARKSATAPIGLPMVSAYIALVFALTAARIAAGSPPGTNVVSIPKRFNVTENCVIVPP